MKNRFAFCSILLVAILMVQCGKDDDGGGTGGTPDITVTTSDFTASINENPSAGDMIGSITGSTNSGSVTFSLTSESEAGAFNIDGSTGALSVADASIYDFETVTTITAVVTVANGAVSQTSNVTVNINDVDDTTPPSVWTGEKLTFTKADNTDPALMSNQDRITDNVWLTRNNDTGALYNAVTETGATATSPAGTQWAVGTTADSNLSFVDFRDIGRPQDQVNKDLVLKLVDDNIILDIKITAWPNGGGGGNGGSGGGFTYERSTPN